MSDKPAEAPKHVPMIMKFVLGGLAGMEATCIVQPLDLVKTRMQVSAGEYKNSLDCISSVIKKEGPLKLYTGIGAGLLRQATYTTGRLGVYTLLNDLHQSKKGGTPTFLDRLVMGAVAGMCGAFIGTPAEVALIRMTADGRLPPEQRRNYTNVANALVRIVKEEGTLTLWRGCIPTMGRAMIVNMAQLATYSQAKGIFVQNFAMHEGIKLHFASAMLSGVVTTAVSMPVDMAKTRIQNMKYVDGKPEYRGTMDVLIKITQKHGPFALWKGVIPYYCRLGPHTVFTFIFLEAMNKMYFKYVLGTSGSSDL